MKTSINGLSRLTRILFGLAIFVGFLTSAQAATYTVTNNADNGGGTLREAIQNANLSAGLDTINFSGVTTIALTTPLPAITDPVFIDGGTNPAVELNGFGTQGAGIASIGLHIRAGGSTVQGMIINRFGEAGIRMDTDGVGNDSSNNIRSCYIGTNAAGNMALGNINRGILIVGTSTHTIGGFAPQRNVISGNQGRGIEITGGGTAYVGGNYIGINAAGTGDLGNTSNGIQIVHSSDSLIGDFINAGITPNVISGNNGSGVAILTDFGFTASGNFLRGNLIGVDAAGNAAIPNNGSGVLIQAGGNTVAGRNVISGNGANGISISTNFATGNAVQGNFIGVGADGSTAIPNNDNGIQISNNAAGNIIGSITGATPGACTGGCNIIANNGVATSLSARAGIYIDTTGGAGNAIRANSIFSNGEIGMTNGRGIDLGAVGANANDPGDLDTGPNNLQNKPVITGANDLEFISGTLNSTASTVFAIDFFVNSAPDTIATSEGRTYIGTVTTTTDTSGNANFNFSSSVPLSIGQFVTATATATGSSFAPQSVGDSSEHSDAVAVINQPTAALVEVSGRVLTADGRGISRAIIMVTDTSGRTLRTRTNAFGFYRFDEIPAGETYTVTIIHKRYEFATQIVTVSDSISNLDFTAEP